MSGLFSDIQREMLQRGTVCSVRLISMQLDDEDQKALEEVMSNKRIPASAIVRRLQSAGHEIKNDAVWRHRRGDCRCATKDES